jgi:hypothetical protein
MKKFILGCLLCAGVSFGLYATSAEEAVQFQQYVELTKKNPNNPKGMTVCADSTYRIIYVTTPVTWSSADLTPEKQTQLRNVLLNSCRKHKKDVDLIKTLKLYMVFSFITSDKKMISVPLSFKEF